MQMLDSRGGSSEYSAPATVNESNTPQQQTNVGSANKDSSIPQDSGSNTFDDDIPF